MAVRWRLGVRGADMLLDDLGLTPSEKHELMRRSRDSFRREFRDEGPLRKQVAERYRSEAEGLQSLLDPASDATSELAPALAALRRRSRMSDEPLRRIEAEVRAGRAGIGITELGGSLVHMHLNRLLRSAQRAQELVIYDFLDRIYMAQAARRA